jgi:ABC-type glycerol-3-phosphate transport system substrate-binding protein
MLNLSPPLRILFFILSVYIPVWCKGNIDTLNWMGHWYKADRRHDLVLEIKREFQFLHQNTHVNLKFPEEIFRNNSKKLVAEEIADMIRSGSYRWDVVWLDDIIYHYVAEELGDPLWGRRYLVDFSGMPLYRKNHKKFISSDPAYRQQTGGILAGPYIEGYYYALYYNRRIAEMIGIEIKPHGMLFDDLLGYLQALRDYNTAKKDSIAGFYESADWFTLEIMFQNLVKSYIGDFSCAKSDSLTPSKTAALRAGLQAFEQMGTYRPLISSHNKNIWFESLDLPLNDKALFFINGTWMYNRWRAIDKMGASVMIPVELPVFKPVDYCLGGFIPTWAVLSKAPNRDLGIELLLFCASPKVAEKWVRYTKTPTGLAGNIAKATIGNDIYELFQNSMTEKYGDRIHYSFNDSYVLGTRNQMLQKDHIRLLRQLLTGTVSSDRAYRYLTGRLVR